MKAFQSTLEFDWDFSFVKLNEFSFSNVDTLGFWRFPDVGIEYIAFARYPPRPDTSHDGGLVGLYPLSHKSYVSSQFLLRQIAMVLSC
jgi:hypothetical protein